ncbi:MAG: HAMP domain-containing sensor histidine kinase [Pseudomonadota bacterium]
MALLFTLLCGATALVLGYFTFYFQKDRYIHATEAVIDTEIKYVSSFPDADFSVFLAEEDRIYLEIKDHENLPVAIPDDVNALTEGILIFEHAQNGREYAAKIHTFPDGRKLLVGVDITKLEDDYEFLQSLSMLSIVLIVLVIIVSYFLSVFVVRGTNKIAMDARDIIDTGDLSQRLEVSSRWDDLGYMTVVLNALLDRIQDLMQGVRQVSDNIAHDLRTPLTRMRNKISELKDGKCDESALDDLLDEADHLLATFNALLRISRIEAEKQRAHFEPIELHTLLADVIEYYEPLAEDKDVELSFNKEIAVLKGDRDLLFQAVANVLDNALKYTPKGGTVSVDLFRINDFTIIDIADSGTGVADDETKKIFSRFYRSDKCRSTPGTGLGLSLVAAVVELHGGTIRAENTNPGLKVSFTFP